MIALKLLCAMAALVLTIVFLPVALIGAAGIVWLAKTDHSPSPKDRS